MAAAWHISSHHSGKNTLNLKETPSFPCGGHGSIPGHCICSGADGIRAFCKLVPRCSAWPVRFSVFYGNT